jgi:hypothetical protein
LDSLLLWIVFLEDGNPFLKDIFGIQLGFPIDQNCFEGRSRVIDQQRDCGCSFDISDPAVGYLRPNEELSLFIFEYDRSDMDRTIFPIWQSTVGGERFLFPPR